MPLSPDPETFRGDARSFDSSKEAFPYWSRSALSPEIADKTSINWIQIKVAGRGYFVPKNAQVGSKLGDRYPYHERFGVFLEVFGKTFGSIAAWVKAGRSVVKLDSTHKTYYELTHGK